MNLFLNRNSSNNCNILTETFFNQTMKPLRLSLNIASLFAVLMVGLIGSSAIAQDCFGKKLPLAQSASPSSPDQTNNNGFGRTEMDQEKNFANQSFQSDASTDSGTTWKLAVIAIMSLAGGSTAFLGYKFWVSRKATLVPVNQYFEFDHPELLLTQLPSEAFPEVQPDLEVRDPDVLIASKR